MTGRRRLVPVSLQGYRRECLDEQKGRTQVANLTMSAVALVFVLFLTSLLAVILSPLVGRRHRLLGGIRGSRGRGCIVTLVVTCRAPEAKLSSTTSDPVDRHAGAVRPPLVAVLWDLDGTLVDTEPYWNEVEHELAERHGGTWSDAQALALIGSDLLACGRHLREHLGIDLSPEQIVEELLDGVVARVERSVPWRPGAREQLVALRAAGVPCALVTMSYQRFVTPVLASLPEDTFDVVVTGETVERGKPHPEPYLTAAAALGVAAEDCLAVEDSIPGVQSAESAGCLVLVVPNHVTVPVGERRVFRDTLLGLDLGTL